MVCQLQVTLGIEIPWSVSKLIFELFQRLIQLILGHQVATIMAHLHHRPADPPQLISFCLVIHYWAATLDHKQSYMFYEYLKDQSWAYLVYAGHSFLPQSRLLSRNFLLTKINVLSCQVEHEL